MAFIDMKDYGPSAKLYWWTVTSLGVLVLEPALMLQVVIGAAVAAIVGFFPVRIPGSKTSMASAEIFIFLLLFVYGPAAAIIAAAPEAFVASYRTSKGWTSRIGS